LKFISNGRHGTILMSLGTNVKSENLSKETLKCILKVFAHFKNYNFVWKFEADPSDLPITPTENVLMKPFLPQNDILAHANVKAFITHTGLLSSQEALWYGKPLIAIPFFCDQQRNAERFKTMGVGVKVDFRTITEESFKAAIDAVISNKSFEENAQKFSKVFRDKPQKPLDVAIWWIEYVIRNPSASHFNSPTLKLGSFVSQSYDVILAFLVLIHIVAYMLFKMITCIRNSCRVSKKKKKQM
jgi:glucuronosyltransferase